MNCINLLLPHTEESPSQSIQHSGIAVKIASSFTLITIAIICCVYDLHNTNLEIAQVERELAAMRLSSDSINRDYQNALLNQREVLAFTEQPSLERLIALVTHALGPDSTLERIAVTIPSPLLVADGTRKRRKSLVVGGSLATVELAGQSNRVSSSINLMQQLSAYVGISNVRLIAAKPMGQGPLAGQQFTVSFQVPCERTGEKLLLSAVTPEGVS